MKRREILQKINIERARQDAKWGYPQKNTLPEWGVVLGEEVGEAMKELNELHFRQPALPSLALGCLITELIQTAAVAVSMVEHLTEYGIAVDDRHPVCFENRIKTDADHVPEDDETVREKQEPPSFDSIFDSISFEKQMSICDPKKHTRCIDPGQHNLGCWTCPVANGLYDAPVDPNWKEVPQP